ncbi:flagellar basal body-associated FliL family protein [Photobacterium sp. BZF1]|uniref:flagellar basal body-associated FliL family protein n=1 Tax=Photobacterium TaxID=657 RepID=UPI001653635A|nr:MULTISPECIES: flagellar basal body-associated FliL family protein [Photobacterium]MBC7005632.1 flagellar basal body-associated FliL family protein [Photobacterium sp. BZF1]MBY5948718.1 flagellar basal body-associated FliL family protein [Photobacterium rosenbergii]
MARNNVMGTKVIIAAMAASALIALSSIGTYAFIVNDNSSDFSIFARADKTNRAHFMNLDKFVISVDGEERTHYLMLELALKTNSLQAHDELIEFKPLARNVLLKMFSQSTYEDLRKMNEIDSLQQQVMGQLRQVLAINGYNHQIEEVLFTKLVLQ